MIKGDHGHTYYTSVIGVHSMCVCACVCTCMSLHFCVVGFFFSVTFLAWKLLQLFFYVLLPITDFRFYNKCPKPQQTFNT